MTKLSSKRLECGYTTIKANTKIYSITRCHLTVKAPPMTLGSLDLFQFVSQEVNYSQTYNLLPQILGRTWKIKINLKNLMITSLTCFLTKLTTPLECFQSNRFNIRLQCINLLATSLRLV